MKKSLSLLLAFAITTLFFIQLAGTLVESIYILDLMNLKLDERALGLLFFFVPALLLPLYSKYPKQSGRMTVGLLFVARAVLPELNTAYRMLAAGLGLVAAYSLFFVLLRAGTDEEASSSTVQLGAGGFALGVALSIFLRTWGAGLDPSLMRGGAWIGWLLAILLVSLRLDWTSRQPAERTGGPVTAATVGAILLLTLVWFSFAAPSVIARWTQGNYTWIVTASSLIASGFVLLALIGPYWTKAIPARLLVVWNLLFAGSLVATLLAQQILYPLTPESAPVIVRGPTLFAQASLAMMLLLSPVIYLDMGVFLEQVRQASPRQLIPGFLLGSLLLVLLTFAHIFSNVWGYVPPVSPLFRGKFWLPYAVISGFITLIAWRVRGSAPSMRQLRPGHLPPVWGVLLAALFLGTALRSLAAAPIAVGPPNRTSLRVMTYNIQQANDDQGERSYERQLDVIRYISPDVLALQESDSTRPSLNNNDYVRYFAEKLGYYSYYGPTTVTGTYGTALLSRFPLQNERTVFTYSDTDEIGTTEAEIEVDGRQVTIYDVHPAGSDTAMLVFARTLLSRSQDRPYMIALGDFNLRPDEEAYQLIASVYEEAWSTLYPTEASAQGVPSPGPKRIDHIFISPSLRVNSTGYVLPPASATDHPTHWAEIDWRLP